MCFIQFYYDMRNLMVLHMFFKAAFAVLLICTCTFEHLYAQQIFLGTPPIRNFSKKEYQAAPQNWCITQRKDGVVFFANNLGVMSFDGSGWQTYPIGNNTIVRSVRFDEKGRLWAGGQGDIGYYATMGNRLYFQSITSKIPAEFANFGDVWYIEKSGDLLFFNTFHEVFVYDGARMKTYKFKNKIDRLQKIGEYIYIHVENEGFWIWRTSQFEKSKTDRILDGPITGMVALGHDSIIVSSLKEGLNLWHGDKIERLKWDINQKTSNTWITALTRMSDGNYALGTSQQGVWFFDSNGYSFLNTTKEDGLQNNTILAMFKDMVGDLWVTTENGIDLIQYHSPYRLIYPDGNMRGTGYAAAYLDNKLYLGTNNGLFGLDINHNRSAGMDHFKEVPGSKGVVWGLNIFEDKMYIGHNDGAFILGDNQIRPLLKGIGTWKFIQGSGNSMLFGTYEGIGSFNEKSPGNAKLLKGLNESCRILSKDKEGRLWMSHPYRGVFKIEPDQKADSLGWRLYGPGDGLTTLLNNYIYTVSGILYSANETGIYKYDGVKDRFVKDTAFTNLVGTDQRSKFLFQENNGNLWYLKGTQLGKLEMKDLGLRKEINNIILPPLPENPAGGFESAFPMSDRYILFNCEAGFTLLDKEKAIQNIEYNTIIQSITILGTRDSILFRTPDPGYISNAAAFLFNSDQNRLRFDFTVSAFGPELKEYRYILEGLGEPYSAWSKNATTTFTNLSPGKYTFRLESRVGGVIQKNKAAFTFTIRPAWYQTITFKIIILLVAISCILLGFQLQSRRFRSEKTKMETLHQELVDEQALLVKESEEEIINLKNQKLEAEINHKNTELASTTMHLVHKKEFMAGFEKELRIIQKSRTQSAEARSEIQQLINLLQQDARLDNDWERFTHYFDEVHVAFIQRLREKYPALTPNDHKLCAYLRMNLSTKEIASLMNISIRGVEGSRYRLRKKMDLDNDANLTEIMAQI